MILRSILDRRTEIERRSNGGSTEDERRSNGERTENERRTNGEQNEKTPSELWVELRYCFIVNGSSRVNKSLFRSVSFTQIYIFMAQVFFEK